MVCFALACQCHALPPAMRAFAAPCRRFAMLASALAMPSSPRKAVALNRYAAAHRCLAMPLHTNAPPSPRGQRHAHAGRCGAPLRSRVAVLRRRHAVRSDALPPPTSALLCNALAVRPNTQPLLCQSSPLLCHASALPSRFCPKPCRCRSYPCLAVAALARAFPCRCWPAHCFAFARRSGAAQCRRRASHCPAFASPCSALPPLIGAPTCLAAASPCSASALLCHSVASPSLAIAFLRRP